MSLVGILNESQIELSKNHLHPLESHFEHITIEFALLAN